MCLRLFTHADRRAASRAVHRAGSRKATSTAMIAITTSNSSRLKPEHEGRGPVMAANEGRCSDLMDATPIDGTARSLPRGLHSERWFTTRRRLRLGIEKG